MSQLDKPALIDRIVEDFATNGTGNITAELLRTFLTDVIDSVPNIIDDASLLSAGLYNGSKTYKIGNLTVVDGKSKICVTETTGSYDATKWRDFPVAPVVLLYDEWDSVTEYADGAYVQYKYKVYRAIGEVGEGNENPEVNPGQWQEVFSSQFDVSSTTITADTILKIPVADLKNYAMKFSAFGKKNDGTKRAYIELAALFFRNDFVYAEAVQKVGDALVFGAIKDDSTYVFALESDATHILVKARGNDTDAESVDWRIKVEFFEI